MVKASSVFLLALLLASSSKAAERLPCVVIHPEVRYFPKKDSKDADDVMFCLGAKKLRKKKDNVIINIPDSKVLVSGIFVFRFYTFK